MPTGTPKPLMLSYAEIQAARRHLKPLEQELVRRVFGHDTRSLARLALKTTLPLTQVRQTFSQAYNKIMEASNVPQAQRRKRLFSAVKRLSPPAEDLSRPEIDLLIQREIQRNIPLHSLYWQSDPELKRLYEAARRRNKLDRPWQGDEPGFYGHGDWYAYLQQVHKVSAIRSVAFEGVEYKRKPYYPGELESAILAKLQRHPAHLRHWLANPELSQLYNAAYKTDARGHPANAVQDRFLGYGDWYAILERKFGIVPVRQIEADGRSYTRGYLPAELVYRIGREIKRGAQPSYHEWQNRPELRKLAYAAEERDSAGQVIARTRDKTTPKPKGYFGYGSFGAMLEAITDGRLTPNNWL